MDMPLKKQLQKSFLLVSELEEFFEESCNRCKQFLSTLNNHVEQYQCCKEATVMDDPVAVAFPDLQERLLCDIVGEIEESIQQLREETNKLMSHCDTLSKLNGQTMKLYNKLTQTDGHEGISTESVTCPPLAVLVEWLVDIERLLLQQHNYKSNLLQSIFVSDPVLTEKLAKLWYEEDCNMLSHLKDQLHYVSIFVGGNP